MIKKIIGIFVIMLLLASISVSGTNAILEKTISEPDNENEKCETLSHITCINELDNEYGTSSFSPPDPSFSGFMDEEWNVLVEDSEWGKIGKVNQQIFVSKLKYDLSDDYDWYNIHWVIQSVPGKILWPDNDWRTDKINNWADCDNSDSYVELIKYGPYGDHDVSHLEVNIGVSAGEQGAQVSCGVAWGYSQEDFKQFDYSDFSDELVSWMHDDMDDDLQQTITVEPGFTIRVPQAKDWTIQFFTDVKFHDPPPWVHTFFTEHLTWTWENIYHNFKPEKPAKPSGASSGEIDEVLYFSTESWDPELSDVQYEYNWNYPNGPTELTDWYGSGETVVASHSWSTSGTKTIQVRAKDEQGKWSEWSQIHTVRIGDCCFPAGTKITMADGSLKNIEDVKVGDKVLSYNMKNGRFSSWRVKMLGRPIHPVWKINDGLISATADHPFYVKKPSGIVGLGALDPVDAKNAITYRGKILKIEVGDKLFTSDKKWIEVTSISPSDEEVQTYNILSYIGTRTYFANEILVYEEHPPNCITNFYLEKILERFPIMQKIFNI